MGALEGQYDGIIIRNFYGNVTINNLDAEAGNDDSNASDEDFKFDRSYEQEWNDNQKTKDTFLSKLELMENGEIKNKTFKSEGKHFD